MGEDIDFCQVNEIALFWLFWNLFERVWFDRNCTLSKIHREFGWITLHDERVLLRTLAVFKSRYVTEWEVNERFNEWLKFGTWMNSDEDPKILSKKVLEWSRNSNLDRIRACVFIIYRLRNNLFHGNKIIENITDQNDMFRQINKFLFCLISIIWQRFTLS